MATTLEELKRWAKEQAELHRSVGEKDWRGPTEGDMLAYMQAAERARIRLEDSSKSWVDDTETVRKRAEAIFNASIPKPPPLPDPYTILTTPPPPLPQPGILTTPTERGQWVVDCILRHLNGSDDPKVQEIRVKILTEMVPVLAGLIEVAEKVWEGRPIPTPNFQWQGINRQVVVSRILPTDNQITYQGLGATPYIQTNAGLKGIVDDGETPNAGLKALWEERVRRGDKE